MIRLVLIALILMVTLGLVPEVQAQVTMDVAKISCDQYTSFKITDPQNIAIWLSGFYNGKRDTTVVDTQGLKEDAKKVWDYCIRNPKIPVMKAVETVLKPDSK
jgi:hypothetical protein